MRRFGTRGRVSPDKHYVVPRTEEILDYIDLIRDGRYIVLFAPRQTGKTTFFRMVIETLATEAEEYFPIQLNFEEYEDYPILDFYASFHREMHKQIESVFQRRGEIPDEALVQFLKDTKITEHVSMREFFENLTGFLDLQFGVKQKVVLIIDEFDGIPQAAVNGFLHSLRRVYQSDETQCPHSVSIVGVKSITQLSYDRSISPFNIQDDFNLPNFTSEQVKELISQYTEEVEQDFTEEVIETLYKQTAGQPFLVNRFAQILTEELNVPKTEPIRMQHLLTAHEQMLEEQNTNIQHLLTNIRRDRRFESLLMRITAYEKGVPFSLDNEIINELVIYGVIKKGDDRMCEIVNPIYQHRIMQAFKPAVNGLETIYFPEDADIDFIDYLTPSGEIALEPLLDNFTDFIARAGFRILMVPETPQEYVGQNLLYAYLDHFVRVVGADMFLEIQTGRGRIDLLIIHKTQKYIVETKIWEGNRYYQAGKKQLAAYLKSEQVLKGYYVVFDHRVKPEARIETETLSGVTIRSYVIPVRQENPSSLR